MTWADVIIGRRRDGYRAAAASSMITFCGTRAVDSGGVVDEHQAVPERVAQPRLDGGGADVMAQLLNSPALP
ncbi:hypothetical protein ACTWPT_27615 [Nonomuraea sp. 3N208]|uniref:hypothetical protein n=1 Tax=Nonomuraea sp. 3N208 TaxID=3457421 RepID=UPI003FD03A4A